MKKSIFVSLLGLFIVTASFSQTKQGPKSKSDNVKPKPVGNDVFNWDAQTVNLYNLWMKVQRAEGRIIVTIQQWTASRPG